MACLIIYPGYVSVQVAVARDATVIDRQAIDKKDASRDLVSRIDTLLTRNNLTLASLSFCAAHIGPGPFTTLRSALSTVNGLAFATTLSLVGVDGLDAFIQQEKERLTTRYLVVILNAFCRDVYYALYDCQSEKTQKGCVTIDRFIEHMKEIACSCVPENRASCTPLFTCVGNGVELYKKELTASGEAVYVPDPLPQECSIEAVAYQAFCKAGKRVFSKQLLPLYLKSSSARLGRTVDYLR